jgi:hypothetical protein
VGDRRKLSLVPISFDYVVPDPIGRYVSRLIAGSLTCEGADGRVLMYLM